MSQGLDLTSGPPQAEDGAGAGFSGHMSRAAQLWSPACCLLVSDTPSPRPVSLAETDSRGLLGGGVEGALEVLASWGLRLGGSWQGLHPL